MSFEKIIKKHLESAIQKECEKIGNKCVEEAIVKMRSKVNQIVAEIGLKMTQHISYRDDINRIQVDVVFPNAPKELEETLDTSDNSER